MLDWESGSPSSAPVGMAAIAASSASRSAMSAIGHVVEGQRDHAHGRDVQRRRAVQCPAGGGFGGLPVAVHVVGRHELQVQHRGEADRPCGLRAAPSGEQAVAPAGGEHVDGAQLVERGELGEGQVVRDRHHARPLERRGRGSAVPSAGRAAHHLERFAGEVGQARGEGGLDDPHRHRGGLRGGVVAEEDQRRTRSASTSSGGAAAGPAGGGAGGMGAGDAEERRPVEFAGSLTAVSSTSASSQRAASAKARASRTWARRRSGSAGPGARARPQQCVEVAGRRHRRIQTAWRQWTSASASVSAARCAVERAIRRPRSSSAAAELESAVARRAPAPPSRRAPPRRGRLPVPRGRRRVRPRHPAARANEPAAPPPTPRRAPRAPAPSRWPAPPRG